MKKRLYKFISIGTASVSAIAATSFVVSCGTKSSHSSSTSSSSDFQSRDVHTLSQWQKDFPQYADLLNVTKDSSGKITGAKLIDNAFSSKGVTTLPDNFYLPDMVNEFGVASFRGVTLNKSFEFPYAIQVINRYAFQGAKLPEGFTIPKNIRTIASNAFSNIEIPNGFSIDLYSKPFTIASTAFADSTFAKDAKVSLTTFFGIQSSGARGIVASDGRNNLPGNINDWSFPVKLTKIPAGAFRLAEIPTDFAFPYWVTKIGANAFYGAKLPENFTVEITTSVGGGAAGIESNAFQGASIQPGFKIKRQEGMIAIDRTSFYGAKITTGMTVDKYTYDRLIEGGINGGYDLEGNSVGTQLTEESTKIDSLDITLDQNGKIAQYAYEGVDFTTAKGKLILDEIKASTKIKSLDYSAFANAKFPADFTLPTSLESIGISAFEGATFAGDLTIPSTVTTVESGSFKNATGAKLVYDASTTKVGESAFSNSDNTTGFKTGITFGTHAKATITEILDSAFNGVKFTENVELPTNLTIIRARAFSGATFPEKLTFPALNVELKEEVFKSATLSKGIDLSQTTTKMGDGVFNSATISGEFAWPKNTTSVARNMFYKVHLPSGFTIPTTVTSIGEFAFSQANIFDANLTLENLANLKEIGKSAFAGLGQSFSEDGTRTFNLVKMPASFKLPAGVKVILNTAFSYTDWTAVTNNVLGALKSDFNFNSTEGTALGSAMFLGAKMNASFELPEKMDYIPSSFFQQAVFPTVAAGSELSMVTTNFSKITAIATGAFQAARVTFTLEKLTALTEIYSGAFRDAKIVVPDLSKFIVPKNTYKTYDVNLFFGANADTTEPEYEYDMFGNIKEITLSDGTKQKVQKVDDYENLVFKSRTIDWVDDKGASAKHDDGNPIPGAHAVLSSNEYVDRTGAPGKGGI